MIRIFTLSMIFIAAVAVALPIEIDNDWLRVVMDDTTGMFTIGKIDNTPLLDGFPALGGAHFVAHIDGVSYSNRPGLGSSMPLLDPGQSPEDNYMSIQWIEDPIRVWQKLYFLPEDSLDAFCNVEFLAYNDSPDSHYVGILFYLDIQCGANDNPILELPTGERSSTISYTSGDLPAYWTFYEHSIHQETTYTHSQGVPFGSLMLYADELYFANSAVLESTTWMPAFLPGLPFDDISVIMKWEPILLTGYSWYIVQSYYGAGYPGFGISEDGQRPRLFSIGSPRPNPFNSKVSVPFEIEKKPQLVSWNIYDLTGRVVKHSQPFKANPGKYSVTWDCTDDYGRELSSGMYLLALWADGKRETKRLVYVR